MKLDMIAGTLTALLTSGRVENNGTNTGSRVSCRAARRAVRVPAIISSFIHLLNGPVFAGEGTMLGMGCYGALAAITAMGVAVMVACLHSPLGGGLNGILISLAAFHVLQAAGVWIHHARIGPLRRRGFRWARG